MTDQALETRERILKGARRRFALGGFHATGVEQIAREAGVSKGALYWHFKSKQEIYGAILEEEEAEALRAVFDPGRAPLPDDPVAFIIEQGERRLQGLAEDREALLLWANIWIETKRGQEEIGRLYREMTEAIFHRLQSLFLQVFPRFKGKEHAAEEILELLGAAFDGLVLQLGVNLDVVKAKRLWRYAVKRIIEGGDSYI
jgi:AcrR family transcriptional regulator